jgi:ATP-dependent DNA ligase
VNTGSADALVRTLRCENGEGAGDGARVPSYQMTLPLKQPYLPMEAKLIETLPSGDTWQYEPKWDGFRCIAFRDGNKVDLQSKSGQPLARYFPEIAEALLKLKPKQFVIDGEIVVPVKGKFSFDDLLMRIHPAASRIKKLSAETPAKLIVFDLLVDDRGKPLVDLILKREKKEARLIRKEIFRPRFKAQIDRAVALHR